MDWRDCPLGEVVPGKLSGVPILKGTRVENFEEGSPAEQISENFAIPETTIRPVLAFPANKRKQTQP